MAVPRPELLTLAREARGLTQSELAHRTGMSQARISKMEAGAVPIDDDVLVRLADSLQIPPEFFSRTDRVHTGGACFKYRRRALTGARNLRQIEASTSIQAMRIDSLLKAVDLKAPYEFPRLDVGDDGDFATPTEAATRVRALWGLPRGPLLNLTSVVESAGAVVIHSDFETPLVDEMSSWVPPRPPMFFLNRQLSGDRLRLTLAHGVGHLVMHHRPSSDEESEANEFAGELLLPEAEIRPYLKDLTLERAATLKIQWKVSMAALVVRAHRLGAISDRRYTSLNKELAWRGWKREEPNAIPVERPVLLEKILRFHVEDLKYSLEDLSRLVSSLPHEFTEVFGIVAPVADKRTLFRVVDQNS